MKSLEFVSPDFLFWGGQYWLQMTFDLQEKLNNQDLTES